MMIITSATQRLTVDGVEGVYVTSKSVGTRAVGELDRLEVGKNVMGEFVAGDAVVGVVVGTLVKPACNRKATLII